VPGWNSEYEWTGWIPFEELPQAYNPAAGFIATANNRVVGDDYAYFITHEWNTRYRAERIVELIEELSANGEKISVADMAIMQADRQSGQPQELLPFLLELSPANERQTEALAYLKEWDGNSTPDSIATSIYQAWLMHLGQTIFEDDLRGDLYDSFARRRHATFLVNIIGNPNNPWCDNILTVPRENCADIAQEAFERALDDLTERLGHNITNWQWEKIHITQYPHNPFSKVPALRYFFHREIPNGGDAYTINVAAPNYSKPYLHTHVVSYRGIYDLSDWNKSLFMHTTGQSGNPLSSHYDDLVEDDQAVKYLPMTFGRKPTDGDVLLLEPN
jgi:penicillin amidase